MKRIYIEITNICNLNCLFCHGTARAPQMMTRQNYEYVLKQVSGRADTLFFHVLGEPLLHPLLPEFINLAASQGFKPCITTNGTLLRERGDEIIKAGPYKVSISLHSQEANGLTEFEEYLSECTEFAEKLADSGAYCALRLWNSGGQDKENMRIMSTIAEAFPKPWVETRSGYRVADRIFLEYGDKFDWPDPNAEKRGTDLFCYGLRDQLAILVDGTVVPCCLDADANIVLGNIFDSSIENIMSTEKAKKIYDGFTRHTATEELCQRCGYAAMKAFRG